MEGKLELEKPDPDSAINVLCDFPCGTKNPLLSHLFSSENTWELLIHPPDFLWKALRKLYTCLILRNIDSFTEIYCISNSKVLNGENFRRITIQTYHFEKVLNYTEIFFSLAILVPEKCTLTCARRQRQSGSAMLYPGRSLCLHSALFSCTCPVLCAACNLELWPREKLTWACQEEE